jgi:hypothetical protein
VFTPFNSIVSQYKIKAAGEPELTMKCRLCTETEHCNNNASKGTGMGRASGENFWWWDRKERTSGETGWKKKSRKTKIKVVGLC